MNSLLPVPISRFLTRFQLAAVQFVSLGLSLFFTPSYRGRDFGESILKYNTKGGVSNGSYLMFGPDNQLFTKITKGTTDDFSCLVEKRSFT